MCLISFATYIWRHAAKEHRGAPRGAPRAPGRGADDAYGALRSLGLDNPPSLLVGALGMLREGGCSQLRDPSAIQFKWCRIMQVYIYIYMLM